MKWKNQHSRDAVSLVVRAVAKRFDHVFHVSELKKSVLRIMPEANDNVIGVSVWNLCRRDKVLESPRRSFYKRKDA